jgi:hypothetical protein
VEVGEATRIIPVAVTIAIGMNAYGQRDVFGSRWTARMRNP